MVFKFFLVGSVFACLAFYLLPRPYPDRLAVIEEMNSVIDNVRAYDAEERWAPNGSQAGLHLLNPARVKYFDDAIRKFLQPPYRVLDIGCGGGLVSNELAALPGYESIDGIDLSPEALRYAKSEAMRRDFSHVRFQNASLYSLPFKNESFDAVVMSDVLEHLQDIVGALKEASRVLRPNGLLVFDTIHRSPMAFIIAILGAEYIVRLIPKGTHNWRLFIRPEELEEALKRSGFEGYAYDGFDASFRALGELSLFSMGMMQAKNMKGGWTIQAPSSVMTSYIGYATRSMLAVQPENCEDSTASANCQRATA